MENFQNILKGVLKMKRQIRYGVFETNSSSQHSLTVMKRVDKFTTEEILEDIFLSNNLETGEENCEWDIWEHEMEFGRSPFRALVTFADKWMYACASLVSEYNDDVYNELKEIAFKYIPNLKKIRHQLTTKYIYNKNHEENKDSEYVQKYGKTEDEMGEFIAQKEKEWGVNVDWWGSSSGIYWHYEAPFTGYVDEDILSGFLKSEGITIEEFLINKKYIVIQDGDEYCEWDNFKKSGLIDISKIEHEYPKED